MSEQPAPHAGILARDIERANERLDWIEQRQGVLPAANHTTIETTVGTVRALRSATMAASEHVAFDFGLTDIEDPSVRHVDIKCRACIEPWPCLTVQLAASERRVAALMAALEPMTDVYHDTFHGVEESVEAMQACRQDEFCLNARAALAAEGAPSAGEGA